ncbi:M24 family metallopeptidase [Candidatus Pseudothioglobus singularis]|nr:M24 family metallopeptidase [Candidatus Pseudothioglobus singularis]
MTKKLPEKLILDQIWQNRVNLLMEKNQIDLLICALSENIFCLTGFSSLTGNSLCGQYSDGEKFLLIPSNETRFFNQPRISQNLKIIEFDSDKTNILSTLVEFAKNTKFNSLRIGVDSNFNLISSLHVGGDVRIPNTSFWSKLEIILKTTLNDSSSLISQIRELKSESQVKGIKNTIEITENGIKQAIKNSNIITSEIDFASSVEKMIEVNGVNGKFSQRVRSFAFCMSGVNSSFSGLPFNISTNDKIIFSEPTLFELATCADGYWCDLTRTYIFNNGNQETLYLLELIKSIFDWLILECSDGAKVKEIVNKVNNYLKDFKLENSFNGFLGHGVGFTYHEMPIISSKSDHTLKEGMVVAIEPGVYIDGKFGIRWEENVYIGKQRGYIL